MSLAEAYAGDELLSDVRVALAIGPVLVQDGDFYGPWSTWPAAWSVWPTPAPCWCPTSSAAALENEGGVRGFETRALRTRNLKDIGRVQAWKLTRAGAEPGADRRRNMRWERLEDVLRELDELRDRGEAVDRGSLPPARGATRRDGAASVAVEARGGDAVGPELEAPLERGHRSAP